MTLRVLFDTDVVVDVLTERSGHFDDSSRAVDLAAQGLIEGVVSATSLTTIAYLSRRYPAMRDSRQVLSRVLGVFEAAAVDRKVIDVALASPIADFEDAVQLACAQAAACQAIVTRNTSHFRRSPIEILRPGQLVSRIKT
jgi:predicted nucleic acid-binding protein